MLSLACTATARAWMSLTAARSDRIAVRLASSVLRSKAADLMLFSRARSRFLIASSSALTAAMRFAASPLATAVRSLCACCSWTIGSTKAADAARAWTSWAILFRLAASAFASLTDASSKACWRFGVSFTGASRALRFAINRFSIAS